MESEADLRHTIYRTEDEWRRFRQLIVNSLGNRHHGQGP